MTPALTKQYSSPSAATVDIFDVLLKMDAGHEILLMKNVFVRQPGLSLAYFINDDPELYPLYDAVKKIKHLMEFVEATA